MRHASLVLLVLVLAGTALAQQSASFKLEEHVLNSGGNPDAAGSILTSANFRISLDSLGEGIVARGLSSASFQLGSGFAEAYAPADEVTGLLFADKNNLEWDPEKSGGNYNLYRDLASNLSGLGFGNCEQQDLTDETAMDGDTPAVNDAYFYLVTAKNRLDEEGTKGFRSNGDERTGTICP